VPQRLANHESNQNLAQSPLGKEGGRAPGDGRGQLGERRPDHTSKPAERRRWREGCPPTGALIARTNARCGLAISVTVQRRDWHTTPHCLTLIPARRVPARGVVGPKRIKVGGTTKRTMCVVCSPGSTPSCQQSREANVNLVGASGLVPWHRRASAMPLNPSPRRWNVAE